MAGRKQLVLFGNDDEKIGPTARDASDSGCGRPVAAPGVSEEEAEEPQGAANRSGGDESSVPEIQLARLALTASACEKCRLRAGCRQVVFGEGNPRARLMLVGEGPGEQEDRDGRPFVGRAGQLLDRILEAAGIERSEVYITNVVKCRPPGNRTPMPDEADACWPWLEHQLACIRPELVVCLGATAARRLVDPEATISRLRGRWIERDGRRYLVTFHPAALLRNPQLKKQAWEDFQLIRDTYRALPQRAG